ncbi:nucleocapsid [Kenkeme virus]|uniref:Nucleoprotein n=1 Tax=Kenkeme virus TaxID=765147 RepID=A0A077CYA9_9VIRU|nr:nucleocapsid [Kenkeme virus]AIL25305.1 nucleocapsid [Kenkeme virus]
MGDIKELENELKNTETQLELATKKLEKATADYEHDDDETNKASYERRTLEVSQLQAKMAQLKKALADATATGRQSQAAADDPTGKESDDHLQQRSMLRYGNTLDMNAIDLDEPSGQTADWLSIITYILTFVDTILLKGLYMLTTRGRQTVKDNKGTRIRLKDDTSFSDTAAGRKPKMLYISMPNAQSSMRADEITPGRYRTVVCGLYPAQIRQRQMISPVMGVIGFPAIAKNWTDRVEKFLDSDCPFLKQTLQITIGALDKNKDFLFDRQNTLDKMVTEEARQIKQMVEQASQTVPAGLDSPFAVWVFAGAPDRCPPTSLYVAGVAELGAFFSILQDMRNTIIASKTVGTAEEKLKKKSSFYQSYLRRTQSMGVQLDQRIIILYMSFWGKEAVDHFHLGDDMDPELRATAQNLIDQKVKEISNMEPMKL